MKSPRAPSPPDPVETAGAQTGMNVGTAIANTLLGQVNQVGPNGTKRYDETGMTAWTDPMSGKTYNIPRFTETTTLDKAGQRMDALNDQTGINLARLGRDQSGRLGGLLSKPFNLNGAPAAGLPKLGEVGKGPNLATSFGDAGDITKSYGTDFSADRQRVEDALMARMQPGMDQDKRALEANLANRGIKLGSAAYDRAQQVSGRNVNDARLGAILGAGEEQSRLAGLEQQRAMFENSAQQQQYGQNLGRATFGNSGKQQMFQNEMAGTGFNNQARQQGYNNRVGNRQNWLNEQFAMRNQPLNEIAALMSGSQVQQPQFGATPSASMPNIDFGGLVNSNYQNQMQAWQAQQQNPWLGGLFGLGSAAIGAL